MPNSVWPPSLPAFVLEEGFSESLADVVLETGMDVGPPKIRRRSTAASRPMKATVQMTAEQWGTFKTFFATTLKGGSLPFDWVDPLTQAATTYRFRKPAPQMSVRGGVNCVVYLTLEVMP